MIPGPEKPRLGFGGAWCVIRKGVGVKVLHRWLCRTVGALGGPGRGEGSGTSGSGVGWALAGGLTSACPPAGHGRADEDCVDDRARHREERLLGARLDRDQEKLLR